MKSGFDDRPRPFKHFAGDRSSVKFDLLVSIGASFGAIANAILNDGIFSNRPSTPGNETLAIADSNVPYLIPLLVS